MRKSNHAFPAQNRACLDSTSPLPMFNLLNHLTSLSATPPRIHEIITMDGGLERLVRLLRDYCAHPPLPEPPSQFYGLFPPTHKSTATQAKARASPYDPKRPFDRAAAYRFSLAFQCVVNIGVRG
ncbi:hypothetical protein K439DRAFT_1648385 [Ramaria rubella]|nr:hypothetical protein K439DRAFT_1648385 [Ramaria rubella]